MFVFVIVKEIGVGFWGSYGPDESTEILGKKKVHRVMLVLPLSMLLLKQSIQKFSSLCWKYHDGQDKMTFFGHLSAAIDGISIASGVCYALGLLFSH